MSAPWRGVFPGTWDPSQAAGSTPPASLVAEAMLGPSSAAVDATATPAGVSVTAAVGSATASGGATNATAAPAGVTATAAQGTPTRTAMATAAPTGQAVTASVGLPTALAEGEPTENTGGAVIIPLVILHARATPDGVQVEALPGSPLVSASAAASPDGVEGTAEVGEPSPKVVDAVPGSFTLDLEGFTDEEAETVILWTKAFRQTGIGAAEAVALALMTLENDQRAA